jgi:hypothetical protein
LLNFRNGSENDGPGAGLIVGMDRHPNPSQTQIFRIQHGNWLVALAARFRLRRLTDMRWDRMVVRPLSEKTGNEHPA